MVSKTVKLLLMEFLTSYETRIADARHPMRYALFWIAAATSQYSEVDRPSLPLILLIFDLEYICLTGVLQP